MIPVIAWCISQDQPFQPLDAATTDLARYNSPQRAAMVRPKRLSVHLMSKHDSPVRVHGPVQLDRCPIVSVGLEARSALKLGMVIRTTYQFVSSLHADIFGFAHWFGTSEDIGH